MGPSPEVFHGNHPQFSIWVENNLSKDNIEDFLKNTKIEIEEEALRNFYKEGDNLNDYFRKLNKNQTKTISAYEKGYGTPIAYTPPYIFVEQKGGELERFDLKIEQYIKENGFDFDRVKNYFYSLLPDEYDGSVYNNRKTILGYMQACAGSGCCMRAVNEHLKKAIEKFPASRD